MKPNIRGHKPAIGHQNFAEIIQEDIFYVDKTSFIREWWECKDKVTLITRPRRFGKTLNMSMMECFFSHKYEGRADLFEGLSIFTGEDGDKYRALQGTYPVIFLSFASIKGGDIEGMKAAIKHIIASAYKKYKFIMESNEFDDGDRRYFASVNKDMDDVTASMALNQLCSYLKTYYGKNAIVLLDEYDTPMQEAWLAGYWDEAVAFTRGLFNSTFKTNECLCRGLITGITRISKESIFSDLNNLEVITTTSDKYETAFGFTEDEVFAALDILGLGAEKQGVKEWYDGFTFGSRTDIYNPWSITGFMGHSGKYDTYWANTSGNGLANSLIQRGNKAVKCAMEDLLAGKPLRVRIDEQIVFNQLNGSSNAIWSLFLATGYFKVLSTEPDYGDDGYYDVEDNAWYTLDITNLETRRMFRKMIGGWFANNGTGEVYNEFVKSLLANDVESMNEFMNMIALRSFSSFDAVKGKADDDEPERFYHGFVLGLMVELSEQFELKSNKESGFGRYDVMLIPKKKYMEEYCAYVIEFKVHKPKKEKSLEETLANAHRQIEERQYEAELVARGFPQERIHKYGFAFEGKNVLIG